MSFWNSTVDVFRYLYESSNTKWYLAILLGFVAYMGKAGMDLARADRKRNRDSRRWRDGE
ncbi:MAG: hypothetical protein LBB14_00030 [Puniceicoccales bacterium]|jgi:hypothetical protein|nr:hypothetical protein [Puniceicoccales bacterium]